jgi:class 3 adenylate cyclase
VPLSKVEGLAIGLMTVLFADVERSTELHTRLGDLTARSLLAEHERLVRGQVAAHEGREVKTLGDGFLLAFRSPRNALECAIAIQTVLADPAYERTDDVRMRIGVHAGEVAEESGDLHGVTVAVAARITATAAGGQILTSEVVRQLAGTVPTLRFSYRGEFLLKGFPEPFQLHELLWRGEGPEFRLLGTLQAAVGGVPAHLGGVKPRAVLAMLLLRLNQVVPTETLVDGLWGEQPPSSATNTLQTYISRLKRALDETSLHLDSRRGWLRPRGSTRTGRRLPL